MKKIILFALSLITFHACAQKENTYHIKGKIGNYDAPAVIYLQHAGGNEIVSQSSALKKGVFSFSGEIEFPAEAKLTILPNGGRINSYHPDKESFDFILAAENMEINSSGFLRDAVISGSKINADRDRLQDSVALVVEKMNRLMDEIQQAPIELANDENYVIDAQYRYEACQQEMQDVYLSFVKNNPDSYISLMIIMELEPQIGNVDTVDALLQGLKPDIRNSATGKLFADKIKVHKTTSVGAVAPDFTLDDPEGKPVRLSDFRGKYLLLDFWASWCGPCRRENPNVVRVYNAYKNKNFEILGVSLDGEDQKQAWLQAIKNDRLTWPQVSDLRGWKNSVAVQYNISTIPQNLLLDPNGVIIAKNLRGQALPAKLAELFD
ncbi:MAG: AhpC/TSA family protein [Dysgonamonadaceae bacterium]|jgi:peroxiredoxin|nr:AhpC/TSA family protein [Dysgonamonadaceae bacterium]